MQPRRDLWPEIRARVTASPKAPPGGEAQPQVWKEWRAGPAPENWVLGAQDGAFEPTAIAGIVVAASVSGLGLAGGGRVLAVGGLIVVLAVVAGQAIRRRIPPGGR